MSEKRKYPSTALSTAQRELMARLVGLLEARGISRSVFRDLLADAEITVPQSSLDRWVRAHAVTGKLFTAEKASGAVPLLDDAQCEIFALGDDGEPGRNRRISSGQRTWGCAAGG